MRAQDTARLLILAAIWGGSFIFMRVAAPYFGGVATAEARVLIAAIALGLFALAMRSPIEFRSRWRQYLMIGVLNSAIPFALISGAEVHLTASMAAILNATSPIFGAIVSAIWLRDRLTPSKVAGMLIAFFGVAILVEGGTVLLNQATVVAICACLLAAIFYGIGATYTKVHLKGAPLMGIAFGGQLFATLTLGLLMPVAWPRQTPTLTAWLCVAALAVFCTALAYLLYYRLIADTGPTKALSVTFLTPMFGMVWGAIFLREAITPTKIVACAIILIGTGLVTGVLSSPIRRALAES